MMLLLSIMLICFQSVFAQDNLQTIKEIRDRGQLRVAALNAPVYPFTFLKSGEWAGFDVQLASKIAKGMGVKLIWDASYRSESELVAALKEDKADIAMSRIKRDLGTARQVAYTKPYVTVKYVLLTNRMRVIAFHPKDETMKSLSQLSMNIGTIDHAGYISMATRRFPAAKITMYPNVSSLIKALQEGKVDAAFCDEVEARFVFIEHPEYGVIFGYFSLPELKSGVVAMVDWPKKHWVAWLNILLEPTANSINVDTLFSTIY
ncbi:substrate-binding periplasmic protein [Undibacterium sp. SXout7W]|uniref:substrate-binding periplasmic protein n=1 Tax=Undibacterium sp. SXout7W TaxID=3413049 RepID=UPI003BF43C94